MIQSQRKTKFRPHVIEALEDRAVPSTMGASVRAQASNTATVQQQLTQVDNQINAAYTKFATTVYQAEGALFAAGGSNVSSLVTSVGQAITTLQGSLTSALAGSISTNALGVVQAQLTASSPGSLTGVMNGLLNAATQGATAGSVASASFPLLATAVNGAIAASYTSATVEAYLYASGKASGNTTNVNLGQYTTQANSYYSSFASTIFNAETFLSTSDGSATSPAIARDVVNVVDQQVGGLVGALGSLVAKTSVASRASVIQAQFIGPAPESLLTQLNSLLGASASPDGSIPQAEVPLLITAIDAAIAASYTSTSVEAYLLATS